MLNKLAADIGLNPVKLENGVSVDIGELLEDLFDSIRSRCAKGEIIKIAGFGTFKAIIYKAGTVHTPLVDGGSMDYDDKMVLKFKQSKKGRVIMNTIDCLENPGKAARGAYRNKRKKKKRKKSSRVVNNVGDK